MMCKMSETEYFLSQMQPHFRATESNYRRNGYCEALREITEAWRGFERVMEKHIGLGK